MSVSGHDVGQELGSYRIEALLGRGGMGVVYLATDLRLGRRVALKLLAPNLADDQRFRRRFLSESRLAASIDHANIVPIYEAGEVDGQLFIAMRYVDGTDLGKVLRAEGPLDPRRGVALVEQLAEALDAAHTRGLLHRDVKPGNVLIANEGSSEHVYLADFGITKEIGAETGVTATDQLVGTIDYLAPERIRGEPGDGRADLYALGCVLYQCLTGEVPFPRADEVAAIYAHLEEEPPRPSDRRPGLPPGLDAVVARALAKDPADRWPNGSALTAAALAALPASPPVRVSTTERVRHLLPRRRRSLVALGTVVAAALAATVAVLAGRSGHSALAVADADAVAVIDPSGPSLKADIATGSAPSQVASGAGAVWVTNTDAQTVSRLDPKSRTVRQTIPVGAGPGAIAVGAGGVWVVNSLDGTLAWISPQTDRVVTRFPVGNGPSGVCVAGGAVWVADTFGHRLVRVDPGSRRQSPVRLDSAPTALACGGGSVWAGSEDASRVVRVDARTRAITGTITTGAGASGMAFADGLLWVANTQDGTVSRIDPRRNAATATVPVGDDEAPVSVAAGAGRVWVANTRSGTLVRIDPKRATVVQRVQVGNHPQGLALVDGALWVGVRASGASHRGGTFRVVAPPESFPPASPKEVDPALSYSGLGWQLLQLTNDGLLAFQRSGGQQGTTLVPDLAAAMPVPSDGGRAYAFRLRRGARYSTGAPVRATDIRRAIERVAQRGTRPQSALYSSIVGVPRCRAHPRTCDLSGGVIADNATGTITFRLSAPDPEFLPKLALPFADAVPARTPIRAITRPLPATGPYRFERVDKRLVRLVRNPRFRARPGRPDGYPDVITQVRMSDAAAVRAVQRGDADYVNGPSLSKISPAQRAAIFTRMAAQVHITPAPAVVFAFLNTRTAPFDNLDARRAVNFAIDRRAVVAGEGGRRFAQVSCSPVPSVFPAYRPACPYTVNRGAGKPWSAPDLALARRLVARSGTRGMRVTVWGMTEGLDREAPVITRTLRRLGYRARTHLIDPNHYFDYVRDSRHRAQIGAGFWQADYPAASNFLEPFFTCRAFAPASTQQTNASEFCDRGVDALAATASRLQVAGQPSDEAWARMAQAVVDRAAFVPLTSLRNADFVSRRVGNYQSSPQIGLLFDQLWVR